MMLTKYACLVSVQRTALALVSVVCSSWINGSEIFWTYSLSFCYCAAGEKTGRCGIKITNSEFVEINIMMYFWKVYVLVYLVVGKVFNIIW